MFTRRAAIVTGSRALAGSALWAGTSPSRAQAPAGPGRRAGHAMAFHAGAAAVCLLGGDHDDLNRDDPREQAWLWNGVVWGVRRTAVAPPAVSLVAAASDSARKSVLIFGGFTVIGLWKYGPPAADLWELDADLRWRQHAPDGLRPPARHHHAIAFDARRGRLVMYGGIDAADVWDTDVWEWDRARWHRVQTPTGPGQRAHHAMAYDSARGRIVLRGGTRVDKSHPTDTWEWDGAAWHLAASDGPGPGGAYRMAYDQARAVTVLFGGDTCVWNGTAWTRVATASAPAARQVHALAYDPVRARVVMHGGSVNQVNAAETWEWDGAAWSQR